MRTFCLASLFHGAHAESFGPCYLYDNYCMEHPEEMLANADPRVNPQDHYKECFLLVPKCLKSGFGLTCAIPNATQGAKYLYKKMYEFREKKDKVTLDFLKGLDAREADICVNVEATKGDEKNGVAILNTVTKITKANGCRAKGASAGDVAGGSVAH